MSHRSGKLSGMELATIHLVPWSDADLELLRRNNTPEMTEHVGGPETDEQVVRRHKNYLEGAANGGMFRIALASGEPAGSIGFWEREWHDERVYETGWGVLPDFQGRGIASAAARLIVELARAEGRLRHMHAYPSVDHPASNAVCRRAGFTLLGETAFEYPPGNLMTCNDWSIDL
jgi:RimJ/RimL family protein N-acetyltransferase